MAKMISRLLLVHSLGHQSVPLAWSLKAPLLDFFDLNGLLADLVVARCEWVAVADGILEAPPALNRNGRDDGVASLGKVGETPTWV